VFDRNVQFRLSLLKIYLDVVEYSMRVQKHHIHFTTHHLLNNNIIIKKHHPLSVFAMYAAVSFYKFDHHTAHTTLHLWYKVTTRIVQLMQADSA